MAVTTSRLIEPIYFHRISDWLFSDAMFRRQKIGTLILANVVQQSACADEPIPIVPESNSCNGIVLSDAIACRVMFASQNVGFIESPIQVGKHVRNLENLESLSAFITFLVELDNDRVPFDSARPKFSATPRFLLRERT